MMDGKLWMMNDSSLGVVAWRLMHGSYCWFGDAWTDELLLIEVLEFYFLFAFEVAQ
jgi:hypothetical protein